MVRFLNANRSIADKELSRVHGVAFTMVASEVLNCEVTRGEPLLDQFADRDGQRLQIFNNPAKCLFTVSQITDDLYLCGACAVRAGTFEKLRISCVINCTTREELPDTPISNDITYLRIPVRDSSSTNLQQYFHSTADTIRKICMDGGKTLVHCIAGVSRSASICLAYLIKYHDMSFKEAYQFVERRRPCIRPNDSFFKQLIEFEIQIRGISSISMIWNDNARTYIPDIYECELKDRLCCQLKLCQKRHCGTH